MNEYAEGLREALVPFCNPEEAQKLSAYVRNKFVYLGLRAPKMKEIFKEYVKNHGVPDENQFRDVLLALWRYEEREMQIMGLYLLDKMKIHFQHNDGFLLQELIQTKPWWDTIDHLAKKHVGYYFELFPEERSTIIEKWLQSDNTWLIRSCILFQLGYKYKTDEELLARIIAETCETNEFFIDKAIGWALREYAKINSEFTLGLCATLPLSNLSKKEAIKNL